MYSGGLHGETTPSSSTPTPPSDEFTFTSEESHESNSMSPLLKRKKVQ